nr:retrovirus-related Pol polyprotein from transposon TNT 1-94 [Tanacetum cinerariifolium]
MKCYNCQGLGHMARQCTMPKRKQDAAWFKEKVLLVQSQAKGKMLDEEELTFLADLGIADGSADQTFTHNAVFQTDDLDAYDSDCDEIPAVAAILMTNLSSCDPKNVFELQYSDYAQNDVFTQSVHKLQYSEQSQNVVYPDVELTSDSNVIPYFQYLEESQQASVPNTDISAQQNSLIMSMFEQISDHATSWDSTYKENKLVNESLTAELDRYKERVKILEKRNNVVQIVIWYLDSGCSKHMTRNRSQLINFVDKFLGTVKFSNDQIAKIMGYGDYQIGNVTISRVNYVEGLGHNLFSAEAVAIACYTQNHSIIRKRHRKTPYELLHDIKPDLSYIHVFGALCYPKNESEDLGKMNARANVGIFVGYAPAKKAYRIYNRRTIRIMETIHVDFDELITMALDQSSSV